MLSSNYKINFLLLCAQLPSLIFLTDFHKYLLHLLTKTRFIQRLYSSCVPHMTNRDYKHCSILAQVPCQVSCHILGGLFLLGFLGGFSSLAQKSHWLRFSALQLLQVFVKGLQQIQGFQSYTRVEYLVIFLYMVCCLKFFNF